MKEIWKDIPWFEWKYQVSSLWRVKRLSYKWVHSYKLRWSGKVHNIIKKSNEKIMTFSNVDWYSRVWLCIGKQKRKHYLVHRLVYCVFNDISLEFLWQKSKTLILHKNDIRSDNRLENLFIWTQKDNMQDMVSKWRWRCWFVRKVKIWFDDIPEIKRKYKELWSIFKVAEIFWVSGATISRALNWKIWKPRN